MISEDTLAKEFIRVINEYYPKVGEVLDGCYVKVVTNYWGRPPKSLRHVVIYSSEETISYVQTHKQKLTDVAENMGLVQVVFRNASRLLRDPMSKIKQSDPRMWLDLQWVSR
ncbi:hypothetical protein Riv7116_6541 [Rivularia sp. PCC 7116]|uniref:hypothetical protein n=1 Tax=Rivularia sp. PCC 7116 TaxID=373994 RepID=UPI00029F27A9|nr:hypothetical protein [Rivularia sp. PCC 7116]AFY58869.1 hypothetical protein Riv7116_6541 [Rivularia sp. PCC 7116]